MIYNTLDASDSDINSLSVSKQFYALLGLYKVCQAALKDKKDLTKAQCFETLFWTPGLPDGVHSNCSCPSVCPPFLPPARL